MLSRNILVLLIILLVPIVPSYLLFRFLPSKAVASGPLQGLQVNLGGAFAAYFIVFLTLVSTFRVYTGPSWVVWTVEGEIKTADQTALDCTDSRYITFTADVFRKRTDGNFEMKFLAPDDGSFEYTRMSIRCQDHQPEEIFLGPRNKNHFNIPTVATVDPKNHTIIFETVTLKPLPQAVASDPQFNPLTALSK